MLDEFKRIFREADLQNLIKIGAPADEYDTEALFLYENISPSFSIEDIQQKIWHHFYNSFCSGFIYKNDKRTVCYIPTKQEAEKTIGTVDNYKKIAESIKRLIGD